MSWTGCKDFRLRLTFGSWWTYDSKNSSEFERVAAVIHGSSPWMLGMEEWLSGDLTGHSSRR
jgi:hypothetical protein